MTGGTGINSQLPGMMGLTGGMGSSNWNGAMGQSVPLVQNPFLGGPFGGASSPFGTIFGC